MKKRIAVVAGDGIGIEVTREAVKVLQAAAQVGGHELACTEFDWGAERYLRERVSLPPGALEMLRRDFDVILLGALGDPRIPDMSHAKDILFGMRFGLDLYANLRPVKLLHPKLTPLRDRGVEDLDFVIVRENTEGLYVAMGGNFKKGTRDEVALQEDVNTYKGVERIIRFAFDYARAHGRKRLLMSDKSNALGYGHDLWQRVFAELAPQYPDIESRHLYIDNLAFQMVKNPAQFEVIVTCNMFGDIVSDLGASLVGGLGLAPSGNVNPDGLSMFEPVHGSAPKYAGQNVANPLGAILTAGMLLDHLGLSQEAAWVEEAAKASIAEGKTTRDLGGSLKTSEVGDWLANFIAARYPARSVPTNRR
ncbi:MAG: 3-isopropylmalate dehydrogenase [Acidobacteria bacterium]|nr:3-isopropylmalate dehydrogenase [Acidobacteriota bacterium]